MKESTKILRKVLFIAVLCLIILFLGQTKVNAKTTDVTTIEELQEAFGEKATVEGSTIKLTDNVTLEEGVINIYIPEVMIDFNGKTIEINNNVLIYNKVTFLDSSTTNKENWGGIIFNSSNNAENLDIEKDAEVIINSGKFIAGDKNEYISQLIYNCGKLEINDAIFSTYRTESLENFYNYMIRLSSTAECEINNGDFTSADTLFYMANGSLDGNGNLNETSFFNECKLTINGGNFNCLDQSAIVIESFYPYSENGEVVTPTITLSNCYFTAKDNVIEFCGGCTEEEFVNEDTNIITILSGTYTSSEGAAVLIDTAFSKNYTDTYCYFNPKDFLIENGTFETLSENNGAFELLGPRKRCI